MYIEPNSTIRLLQNIPIDPDQTDTLYFDSTIAQEAYFTGKTVKTFSNQTFQRHNRGYIRVESNAKDIYPCNYMMFRNTSYDTKWFYAFVNSVEYINDAVSEISFTIDPVQSYFFQYQMDQCFIERAHTLTDQAGDNITPENLELGEMVLNYAPEQIGAGSLDEYCIVILYTDPEAADPAGYINEGIYQGCAMVGYGLDEEAAIRSFINRFAQAPESIVAMYMCPIFCGQTGGQYIINPKSDGTHINVGDPLSIQATLDGYTPKNKKLYTYPFNYFCVLSGDGQSMPLRYEFFPGQQPQINFSGNACAPVSITCMPYNYKGCAGEPYWGERITLAGFPECSWSTDAFRAWVAQNSVPISNNIMYKGIKGTVNSVLGLISTDPTGGIRSTIEDIAESALNILNQAYTASIAADITKGSVQNGSGDFAANRSTFTHTRMSISRQYAERIDHYFDMFGYCIGKHMIPPRHNRQRWTYVKTIGANCQGTLPADDAQFIANCYNRGIRFWADTANVGNYSLDNPVLSL